MSWYRINYLFILFYLLSFGIVQAKELRVLSEDELIVQGLLYEEYSVFEGSHRVYRELYDITGARVYLFKEVTASILGKIQINESIRRLKLWEEGHPDSLESKRLLIPLYLAAHQVVKAKHEAEYLIERSSTAIDLELASNPFLYAGEFDKALKLLTRVYQQTSNEAVLLRMVTIMDEFTGEGSSAIKLLEAHQHMNHVSNELYFKLLSLYAKENSIEGVLRIYTILYEQKREKKYLNKILDAYAYKRDLDGAIGFLEKYQVEESTLYQLYRRKKLFDKAYALLNSLYKKEKDARWIAEKGVILFEKSEDKEDKEMIRKVLAYFEKAIEMGVDDSIYLNYYGYTLIDSEIDVQKGIAVLKDALKQQPDNTYYLDSLAWGYYKTHQCKKAYELMQRVIAEEGLEEAEIIEHWNTIQKCK